MCTNLCLAGDRYIICGADSALYRGNVTGTNLGTYSQFKQIECLKSAIWNKFRRFFIAITFINVLPAYRN